MLQAMRQGLAPCGLLDPIVAFYPPQWAVRFGFSARGEAGTEGVILCPGAGTRPGKAW